MQSLVYRKLCLNTKSFIKLNKIIINKTSTSSIAISPRARSKVGWWLAGMSGMTMGAVVLGGVTRLTESGLSMTSWSLLKERPPFNEDAWLLEFERYKQYPEYNYIMSEHGDMSLAQFKFIWWMEYGHRMWGRLIGATFALPAAWFYYKGYFDRRMKPRVLIFGGLILFQGLLGWYMVKSGLETKEYGESQKSIPRVSQYRLAAHLTSAVALYSLFFWNSLTYLTKPINQIHVPKVKMIRGMTHGLKLMIVTTIISGAFVAGLDAGLTYNTFPKMADRWFPTDLWALSPTWINIFENPTTVQFNHRLLGQSTGVFALILWGICHRHQALLQPRVMIAINLVAVATLAQIALGISTLVHFVPVKLAAMHQTNSLVLLSTALWLGHLLRKVPK